MPEKKLSYTLRLLVIIFLIQGQLVAYSRQCLSQDLKGKAVEWFNAGDFQKALPVFTKLVYDFPYDYLVKYYAGASLVETGDYGIEAEKNLLLASGSEVPVKVWYYLGRFYHAKENWNNAQRFYNRFRNNADSTDISELRIDELAQFCFNHINPFITAGKVELQSPEIVGPDQPADSALIPEENKDVIILPSKQAIRIDTLKSDTPGVLTWKGDITGSENQNKPDRDSGKVVIPKTIQKERIEKVAVQPELPPDLKSDSVIISKKSFPDNPVPVKTDIGHPVVRQENAVPAFIRFRINERVTYLVADMFQEPAALKEFRMGEEKSRLLDSLLREVERLRERYHTLLAPDLKDSLAGKIRNAEFSNVTLKNEIGFHYSQAAILENLWWKDAGLSAYERFLHVSDSLEHLQLKAAASLRKETAGDTARVTTVTSAVPGPMDSGMQKTPENKAPQVQENKQDEVVFKVQLGICDKTISPLRKKLMDKISKIRTVENYINEKGHTICTTGNLTSYEDALVLQNQIRQEGIKDAFVIALKNGKRVPLPAENVKKQ